MDKALASVWHNSSRAKEFAAFNGNQLGLDSRSTLRCFDEYQHGCQIARYDSIFDKLALGCIRLDRLAQMLTRGVPGAAFRPCAV
jgi:hypothetical protein